MLNKPFQRLRDESGKYIKDSYGRYKYALSFRVAGRGTRRVNRRAYFKDDLEAAAEVARLRGDIAVVSGRFTWDDGYTLFLSQKGHLTSQYLKEVKFAVDYVKKECGTTIEGTTLAAYTAAMRKKAESTSARRANNIRIQTLSVARFCEGEGVIARIPFDKAPARPEKRSGRKPFPLDRFSDYLMALDKYARPVLLALAASGDRLTAICRLNIFDVHTAEAYIELVKKGGKRRKVPLSEPLQLAIKNSIALEPLPGYVRDSDTIFIDSMGKKWSRWSFRRNVLAAWKKAGLEEQVVHSLRNMIATNLAESNANRHTISASLGHDNTATADIYVKVREQLKSAELGFNGWANVLMKALPKKWCTDGARRPKKGSVKQHSKDK